MPGVLTDVLTNVLPDVLTNVLPDVLTDVLTNVLSDVLTSTRWASILPGNVATGQLGSYCWRQDVGAENIKLI